MAGQEPTTGIYVPRGDQYWAKGAKAKTPQEAVEKHVWWDRMNAAGLPAGYLDGKEIELFNKAQGSSTGGGSNGAGGVLGGAASGAGIGGSAAGPIGAAGGAVVGAAVGGILGRPQVSNPKKGGGVTSSGTKVNQQGEYIDDQGNPLDLDYTTGELVKRGSVQPQGAPAAAAPQRNFDADISALGKKSTMPVQNGYQVTPKTMAGYGTGVLRANPAPYVAPAQTDEQILQSLRGYAGDSADASRQASRGLFQNAQASQGLTNNLAASNADALNQQRSAQTQYNQMDMDALGRYTGATNNANAFNQANFGQLQQRYGTYGQLSSSPGSQWQGDLSSQAAQAYADPGSIAAQNQALSQLQGVGGGSLDVTSQAAQAYADPQAIAAQYQALGQLQSAASGGLNTTSQAAQAYADPNAVRMQMDAINRLSGVANGEWNVEMNPDILRRQNEALDQYDAWRTPELTDQERFMKELARSEQEQQDVANRGAISKQYAMQGMGGSGLERSLQQTARQQTGQNRLLRDLGANANAVERAERSLQGYAALGTDMQGQFLQNEHQNKAVQMQALGLYTDATGQLRSQTFDEAYKRGLAGDQTAMANADRQLRAAGMSADTAGNIRQQSFNESYSRGMAADSTAHANSDRRFSGMTASGDLASTQRNQSFNESFSRGTAADQTAQYNRSTSLAASQWNDSFAADQQAQAWGRDTDMYGAGRQFSSDYMGNEQNQFDATRMTSQTGYGRTQDTLAEQNRGAGQNWEAGQASLGQSNGAWQYGAGAAQQNFGNQSTLAGIGLSANAANRSTAIQDEQRRQQDLAYERARQTLGGI